MADANILLMGQPDPVLDFQFNDEEPALANFGFGEDISIRKLAEIVVKLAGFTGQLAFDASRDDYAMRKLLDVERLKAMGWTASMKLERGIEISYQAFIKEHA